MKGQCLCGAVRFSGEPDRARGITPCHCGQCRRWAGGGPFMSVRCTGGVELEAGDTLVWFASSEFGERGSCNRCGSSLFWRRTGEPRDWAINASMFPEDHGLTITRHIWADDQPGWYDFADKAPRMTAAQCRGEAE